MSLTYLHFRTPKNQPKKSTESFDVYGHRHINQEFLRLVYNILKQLLPTVQYDLHEDVDGEKSDSLVPEESPLLPGPVKMHRKADIVEKRQPYLRTALYCNTTDSFSQHHLESYPYPNFQLKHVFNMIVVGPTKSG